jgi:hypothetical protein
MNNFEETPYVLVLDGRDTDRDATRLLVATYASMPDFMGSCIQQNKTRKNKEVYRGLLQHDEMGHRGRLDGLILTGFHHVAENQEGEFWEWIEAITIHSTEYTPSQHKHIVATFYLISD